MKKRIATFATGIPKRLPVAFRSVAMEQGSAIERAEIALLDLEQRLMRINDALSPLERRRDLVLRNLGGGRA